MSLEAAKREVYRLLSGQIDVEAPPV